VSLFSVPTLLEEAEAFPMQLYVCCDLHNISCCEGPHVAPT